MTLPISACLISKNEDETLRRCLDSLKGIFSQIVVANTGDTDHVTAIAEEFGAKTFRFKWCDDFSAARNATLEAADQPWIFVIDADEVVTADSVGVLTACINKSDVDAFNVVTKNYTRQNTCTNWFPLREGDEEAAKLGFCGWFPSYKVRLFRNKENFRFTGRVHELVKAPSETAEFYVHHLHEDEKNSDLWRQKKEYYLKLGQMKLSENPNDAQANFELGLQYSELNKPDQAISCFKKVLDINPMFGDQFYGNAFFEIGNIYSVMLKNIDMAIKYFKEGIKQRPEHASTYYNLAHVYQNTGNLEEAEKFYREAIDRFPQFAVAYNNLSNILIDQKRFEEALGYATTALELNPHIPKAHHNYTYALFQTGKEEEATKILLDHVQRTPNDSGGLYNLGRFYYKMGHIDKALKFMKLSIQANPSRQDPYSHIASIYIERRLYQLANMVFEHAMKNCPKNYATLYNYGLFKCETGRLRDGEQLLLTAYKIATEKGRREIHDIADKYKLTISREQKIVGAMVLFFDDDEARESIRRASHMVDELVIVTNSQLEISAEGKASIHVVVDDSDDEDLLTQKAYHEAMGRNADWILWLNPYDAFRLDMCEEVRVMTSDSEADAWTFPRKIFWSGRSYFINADTLPEVRLHRAIPGLQLAWTENDAFCGNMPTGMKSVKKSNEPILAYNQQNLPIKEINLVQGDVPILNYNRTATIVIPVRYRPTNLKKCITAIKAYTDFPYEVVIVANKLDMLTDIMQENGKVSCIASFEADPNTAQSLNQGIEWSKNSHYVVTLSPDVIVTPNWLSGLIRHLDNAPRAGVVCPRINKPSCPQDISVPSILEPFEDRRHQFSRALAERHKGMISAIPFYVGDCAVFTRNTFNEIGQFDVACGAENSEDLDLSLKLKRESLEVYMALDTFVYNANSALDGEESHAKGMNKLREKWGDECQSLEPTKSISCNFIFGMAISQLPEQTVPSMQREFNTVDAFKSFMEDLFSRVYKDIEKQGQAGQVLEAGIALLPPNIKEAETNSLTRWKFETLEEGMEYLQKFMQSITEQRVHA